MKTILNLNREDAKSFFLEKESYLSLELPEYFNFQELIYLLDKELEGKELKGLWAEFKAKDLEDVNYKILNNKDGKYAWRPFQLIHPVLYVKLVQKITEETNWNIILERFKLFSKNKNIECYSLDVIEINDRTNKENQVYEWWEKVEQRSLVLALKYNHLLHLDISDCYSSIYTHSIVWALHTKKIAKEKKNVNTLIGNIIDKLLQDMSNGQTNGIPQGSTLMDFIAEMVLGYGDLLLTERLKAENINDYKIIRYRDDYRIFSKNAEQSAIIAKELTEILSSLNFKINNKKTVSTEDLILGAIKPDKLHWIYNKRKTENVQKWLLQLYIFSEQFPNSGTLYKEVKTFLDWLQKKEESIIGFPTDESEEISQPIVLISILINMAYKNPKLYPLVIGSVSILITKIESLKEQKNIINKIIAKFKQLPNTSYLNVWLQRLVIKIDTDIPFSGKLCEKVMDNSSLIWNSNWLNPKYQKLIKNTSIINFDMIEELDVSFSEYEIEQLGGFRY
ncbi:RNA-directed DNA polymerase [Tenacibaculum dicentrarchi]|uniref:RNA-directed DNA polymerase n=1 Tax=Tenacibaculum dicentrarchi TaxID=669041 RepID=UPI003511C1F9